MRVLIAVGGFLTVTNLALAQGYPPGPAPAQRPVYAPAPPPVYAPAPVYAPPYVPPPPPPPPPFSWSGFYVGINGGFGFASAIADISSQLWTADLNGAVAGGQIGGNYQAGAFVLGLEADMQWSGQTVSTAIDTIKLPWFSTVRVRAGAAIDHVFFYSTGGLVVATASDAATSLSNTNVGWTIGAGTEVALNENFSIKVEYLFMETNFSAQGPSVTETATVDDSIFRAGLNYRFPIRIGSPY